ncbi:histidine phosphatase family protein [Baekduia soli]|uniref:Histidine phosphatase family protein n=1 Tax=Baekduia soli TaxID=496014 RepID=A0A5B8U4R3_9ACTN|nr:histidine phosphatase family protein [Baekduia soli]QEC48084.1 histidine phosphatase family protein [Baekduia soli]
MPSVLLVRHGQASYGGEDYDVLSEIGHRQAAVLAGELQRRGVDIHRLVSGGLNRQRDTAAAFAATTGLEVEVDPGWDEYDSQDVLTHHSTSDARLDRKPGEPTTSISSRDFQDLLDGVLTDWITAGDASPAAEPWTAFDARVRAAMDRVIDSLGSGQTALVVSSGGTIGGICAALLGMPPTDLVTFNRVAVNTGITRLVSGRSGVTLVTFNEHGHLDGMGPELRTYR